MVAVHDEKIIGQVLTYNGTNNEWKSVISGTSLLPGYSPQNTTISVVRVVNGNPLDHDSDSEWSFISTKLVSDDGQNTDDVNGYLLPQNGVGLYKRWQDQRGAHQGFVNNYYTTSETSGAQQIRDALALKENKLVFNGTNNTITAINNSAIGGGATGAYVPLNATDCSVGSENTAYSNSLAQGLENLAETTALAQGSYNYAYYYSLAQGYWNSASVRALAQGYQNTADHSLSQGEYNFATNYSLAQGYHNSAYSASVAVGNYNKAGDMLYYGAETIEGNLRPAHTEYVGNSLAVGNCNSAKFESLAVGDSNVAISQSLALGIANRVSDWSTSIGESNTAVSTGAVCFGIHNYARNRSIACGYYNYAADYSQAFGDNVKAAAYSNAGNVLHGTFAIGTFNKTSAAPFVIGDGVGDSDRSDLFVIDASGNISAKGQLYVGVKTQGGTTTAMSTNELLTKLNALYALVAANSGSSNWHNA